MYFKFLWIGKTKNPSIKSLISDYAERIRHMGPCEILEARDISRRRPNLSAAELVAAEGEELAKYLPGQGHLAALDEKGVQFASRDFARWIESEQNSGIRGVTFLIGGPEGLSRNLAGRAHVLLSMGKMTWTHEMCRVLLLEQVYRALCMIRGIPYHKGGNG